MQLLAAVLLSMFIAAAAFASFFTLGNYLLDHTVYGQGFAAVMADKAFVQLEDYVRQEEISAQKLRRLNAWCSTHDSFYLAVYLDNKLAFETPIKGNEDTGQADYDPQFDNEDQRYVLILSDGTITEAFIYYFADEAFFIWMSSVSGLLAFIVFSICFISLVHRKLRYIQKLKRELDILAGGDLEHAVTVRGGDELAELAFGIDEMRRSILAHQHAEEEMRTANSQLVTAMSHDLRTPLTSLMAYLELLDRNKVHDEEQKRTLIHQSLTKAQSIKAMADKLFEYFLVYTTEWEQPELEPMDADSMMAQFWQEYAFALESRGFCVQADFNPLNGSVCVKVELLQRAFDNLFSNLLKYADIKQPVKIAYRRQNNNVCLTLTNAVSPQRNQRQSTNIGLNTCRRIVSMHSGSFHAQENNGLFEVEIKLPLSSI